MDAARFAQLAELAIADIRARGKRAIVCGGTFLWVRALIHGARARATRRSRAARAASGAGHGDRPRRLARRSRAGRSGSRSATCPNDFVRVSRALEVYELTGVRMSEWQAQHGFKTSRHAARLLAVRREKDELDLRIRARCQAMLAAGWIEEARELMARGYQESRPFASVGYKQGRARPAEWRSLRPGRARAVDSFAPRGFFARRQAHLAARSADRVAAARVDEAVMVTRVVDRPSGARHPQRARTIEHHGQLLRPPAAQAGFIRTRMRTVGDARRVQ